jgi:hypothetical protein
VIFHTLEKSLVTRGGKYFLYALKYIGVNNNNNNNNNIPKVFENNMLRRIFGPKRDEVTGGWRKLHNEELHNL